jgi:hypothetical protein
LTINEDESLPNEEVEKVTEVFSDLQSPEAIAQFYNTEQDDDRDNEQIKRWSEFLKENSEKTVQEGAKLLEAMGLLEEYEVPKSVIDAEGGDLESQKLEQERGLDEDKREQSRLDGQKIRDGVDMTEDDEEPCKMGQIWLEKLEREDEEIETEDEREDDQVELDKGLVEKLLSGKKQDQRLRQCVQKKKPREDKWGPILVERCRRR